MKKIFSLPLYFFLFSFLSKAQTINCNTWLNTPTLYSKVTIGDLDVTGNQITVEGMFNLSGDPALGIGHGGKLVTKLYDASNVNYSLFSDGCEITTTNSGYKSIFVCAPLRNQTYHVAMVYDGATLKFYRNGFLMSSTACTGNIVNNDIVATIAQLQNGAANPSANQFSGRANEIRIWNVARTQAQIKAFMNSPLPNPTTQTGLLAYYSFDNLLNKQGNPAFNGVLSGGGAINTTNPNCTFLYDSCGTIVNPPPVSSCNDTCYWKVTGNTIINGNNIFGTLSNNSILIQTNATNRGTITNDGKFGWNTITPTANLHTNGTVRLENLPTGNGNALVVDANGNVKIAQSILYKTSDSSQVKKAEIDLLKKDIEDLKIQLAELKKLLFEKSSLTLSTNNPQYQLSQNIPNPSNNTTIINYSIPLNTKKAIIKLSTLNGVQERVFELKNGGTGSVTVYKKNMAAGTYIYSLIIDGVVIDSKKMVITN